MSYTHSHTTREVDPCNLWAIKEEKIHPEPLPLTVVEVFGPRFTALVMTDPNQIYCANATCQRNLPTMQLIWEIARSRNIVCCKVPL